MTRVDGFWRLDLLTLVIGVAAAAAIAGARPALAPGHAAAAIASPPNTAIAATPNASAAVPPPAPATATLAPLAELRW